GAQMWQYMVGCDLLEDGSTRGFYQHAYDGRDFIALDKDTMTFTAVDTVAQITKKEWEEGPEAESQKYCLENSCIERLRKYLSYGRAVLERKGEGKTGTLGTGCCGTVCRPSLPPPPQSAPRDQQTEWGSIAPNSDGTFYTWASIEARPEEKDKYRCRVDHVSLREPSLFAWGEP
ncbi:Class I histocompatibility antigen, F10 alpha chain, partial [Mesitornis unicolor]